jgi:hypothetical protein
VAPAIDHSARRRRILPGVRSTLGCKPGLSLPFDEAEAMTEWIAAECHGSVVRVLEDLLLRCASAEGFRESRFEVIDMNV